MRVLLCLIAGPLLLLSTLPLASYGTGALPGTIGNFGMVPRDVATDAPSCGTCHGGPANQNNLVVDVQPTARILSTGQSISITTSATGGRAHPQNWGGFVTKVTAGTLSAGATSQTNAMGDHITHVFAFNGNRNWTYGFTAPNTPGLVEIYSVVNTVDGDGRNLNDLWGFNGATVAAQKNTAERIYVNAANVQPIGIACVGGFGNLPVLGALDSARVGQPWTVELHGAAPNAPVALFVGANPNFQPIDLGLIGLDGCSLWVEPSLTLNAGTGPGDPARAEGSASVVVPVPGDPNLAGVRLQVQAIFLDPSAIRSLAATATNGLDATIQP